MSKEKDTNNEISFMEMDYELSKVFAIILFVLLIGIIVLINLQLVIIR